MATIGAVINSESGTLPPDQVQTRLREVEQHLRRYLNPGFLKIVPGSQVESSIRQLLSQKIDILVVGGGDGTISTAAGHAAKAGITLAVIPMGTRNHLARDLNLPLDPAEAIHLLEKRKTARMDLGEVNGRLFINNASAGLYPKVVRTRDQTMTRRGWKKWPAALLAAIKLLWRSPQMHLQLEINGQKSPRRTPVLFAGNNEYQGGLLADSKRPSLSEGQLWICTARVSSFSAWIAMIWQGSIGNFRCIKNMDCQKTSELTVHFRQPRITIALDGENHILDTPLQFTIRPKALNAVVP